MTLDPDFRQDDGECGAVAVPSKITSAIRARTTHNKPPQNEKRPPDRLPTNRQPPDMVSGRRAPARRTMRTASSYGSRVDWERILPTQTGGLSGASPERTEPNSLLNHETSDHLLSLVEKTRPSLTASPMCAGRGCDTSLVLQKFSADPSRLSLRRFQPRQSSVTRSISAQAGTTSGGCPACWTTNRPRLNPIASSSESFGISAAAT